MAGAGTTITLLQKLAPAFSARHPGVEIIFLPDSHTAGGIDIVAGGQADIGALARQLHLKEKRAELSARYFATDPVVFVAHPSVGITGLTRREIRSIFSGEVSDWGAAGGNGKIVLIDRPPSAAAWELLAESIFEPPFQPASGRVTIDRSIDTVEAVADTPGAIGYLSLGIARMAGPAVTILAVDGVAASAATVRDGSYPFVRSLGIVFRTDASPAVVSLADFLGTDEARKLIIQSGFLP